MRITTPYGRKTKLTAEQVAAIRARYTPRTAGRPRLGQEGTRQGSKRQLAQEFNVSPTLIGYIVHHERRIVAMAVRHREIRPVPIAS